MKILSRDFTIREKVLLLFLSLFLVGLAYFQFIDRPVRQELAVAEAEKDALQMELDAVMIKAAQLQIMEEELKELSNKKSVSVMESYNNSKAEIKLLNDILANTTQYSIVFSNVTRNGDQIRRDFSLQFVTADYKAACKVLEELGNSRYRCLIGNIACSAESGNITSGPVNVNATATFYETMVGGIIDSGLPADENRAESPAVTEGDY